MTQQGGDPNPAAGFNSVDRRIDARSRKLIEDLPLAALVVRDLQIVFANPAAVRLWAAPGADRLIGRSSLDLFHPRDREKALERARRLERGEELLGKREYTILKLDGTESEVEIHSHAIVYDGQPAIMSVSVDISERKAAEAALRDSEALHRSLMEELPAASFIHRGRQIVFANAAGLDLVGASSSKQVLGKSLTGFVDPKQQLLSYRRMRRLSQGERAVEPTPLTIIRLDGAPVLTESRACWTTFEGRSAILSVLIDVTERVKAEFTLGENETRYRDLIEGMPTAMFVVRGRRVIYANPATLNLLRAEDVSQVVGRLVSDFIHPDDLAQLAARQILDEAGKLPTGMIKYTMLALDGAEIQVEMHVLSLEFEGKRAALSVAIDVTAATQADRTRRENEQRYHDLIEGVPTAIFVTRALRIVYANAAALKLLCAVRPSQVIGRDAADFIQSRDLTRSANRARALTDGTRRPEAIEYTVCALDGSEAVIETRSLAIPFEGEPAMLTVCIDVTADKEAARAVRESEERFRLIFDSAPMGMVLIRADDALMIQVNSAAERMLGYEPGELLGKEIDAIVHPENSGARERVLALTGHSWPSFERKLIKKNGNPIWARVTMSGIGERDGHPEFVLDFLEDITLEKQAETALLQSQRMEAVGQMTAGVAHEFNNLLAVILGNLEFIKDEIADRADLIEEVDNALNAVDHGADLIKMLMAYSQQRPASPILVDPNSRIKESVALLQRTLGPTIEIIQDLDEASWQVRVDPTLFDDAIRNMVMNSRDAMPKGGWIKIVTKNASLDEVRASQNPGIPLGDYVVVSVADCGSGIDPALLDRVFDPFFTTKGVGKGTGLGLSMVYGFVKQSEGHKTISSTPGLGTTLSLYLPKAAENSASQASASGQPAEVSEIKAAAESILVVEDNSSVRATLVALLKTLGYQVFEAATSAEGLEVLSGDAAVDLLLTDVMLSESATGADVARVARSLRPALKVVFMSGYTGDVLSNEGTLEAGVVLLQKPFTKQRLSETLRQALRPAAS
jgi:PAS domain S-box-containing protein